MNNEIQDLKDEIEYLKVAVEEKLELLRGTILEVHQLYGSQIKEIFIKVTALHEVLKNSEFKDDVEEIYELLKQKSAEQDGDNILRNLGFEEPTDEDPET